MLPYGLYSALWIYFGSVLWNTSMATVRPLRDTVRDTSCELIDDPTAREARVADLFSENGFKLDFTRRHLERWNAVRPKAS